MTDARVPVVVTPAVDAAAEATSAVATSGSAAIALPRVFVDAGPVAVGKSVEFFAGRIANARTRAAYARAVGQFLGWCEARGLRLEAVSPLHVAAYIRTHPGSAPTVKQHLAAIRMLGDWLIVSQILPVNPAAVRGRKHVVTKGATPVLEPAEARKLLKSIDTGALAGLRDRALLSVMLYSFARVSAVLGMRRQDFVSAADLATRSPRPSHPGPSAVTPSRASPVFRAPVRALPSRLDQLQPRQQPLHAADRRARRAGLDAVQRRVRIVGRRNSPERGVDPKRPETGYHQALDPPADRGNTDVATTQPAVKYTYEDYRTTPDDQRYELLDGDLIMVPAPNLKHQIVLGRLYYRLQHFVAKHDLGLLLFAPCDVFLSNTNVVQPDLLFVSHERAHLLSGGENVQGPPDLVIEILSPSSAKTDRGAKLNLYSEHGVAEYWLVDPIAETITIHRQRRGALIPTRTFARGDTLRSPLLAGLDLDLDDIFAV